MNSSRRIMLFWCYSSSSSSSSRARVYRVHQFLRHLNSSHQLLNLQSQPAPQRLLRYKKVDADQVISSSGDPFGLENENFEYLRSLYQGLYLDNSGQKSNVVAPTTETETQDNINVNINVNVEDGAKVIGELLVEEKEKIKVVSSEVDDRMAEYQQWLKDKEELRRPMVAELLRKTNYGSIRLDLENLVQIHGQFDEEQMSRGGNEKAELAAYLDGKNLNPGQVKEGSEAMRQIDLKMTGGENQEIRIRDQSYNTRSDESINNIIENIELKSSKLTKNQDKDQNKDQETVENEVDDLTDRPKTAEEYLKINKDTISQHLARTRASELVSKPNPHIPKPFHLPNYNLSTHSDLWDYLRRSIIFQNEHLVAINKPIGISIHDSSINCRHKIIDFNEDLAKFCKVDKIHPIHRLDKDTSGVLIFAKNEKASAIIRQKFADRQVHKVYLAITKNVPEILEGTIDIPIGEGKIPKTNELRAILKPDLREYNIKTRQNEAKLAITKYRVIKSRDSCSFLEVIPETGVKHQIRVHLASAINCPILGDHKFSHPDKLAPQRLSPEILDRLKVLQSKVRYLPMHLHCSHMSFFLPPQFATEQIYIHAKVPRHFMYTLKTLGLK